MVKKILLVGNGGREHTIADAVTKSRHEVELYNFATAINPGIKNLCHEIIIGDILNMDTLKKVAKKIQPDFAIIGPDDPIGLGATDTLNSIGIPSFAPTKKNAQLESSKSFTRNLLQKYDINASPDFLVCTDVEKTEFRKDFYEEYDGQIVVKADGLMGGKGVIVAGEHFDTFEEADDFAQQSIQKFGRVVLEEKIEGEEFSLISIVDGKTVLGTPAIQDHKRAFDGDTGPNTGGMGCVSDEEHKLPFITAEDLAAAHEITVQTMKAVEKETGEAFIGVMYGGFMITKRGVKLIEYNCRFGDPEALNILPILKTDFVDVCEAAINQELDTIGKLDFEKVATVVKYLCPEGYPTAPVKNIPIVVSDIMRENDAQQVFYASVEQKGEKILLKGSRAIGILGTGRNMSEALAHCEDMIQHFGGPLFYRKDIGTPELLQKRIDHMARVRNMEQ